MVRLEKMADERSSPPPALFWAGVLAAVSVTGVWFGCVAERVNLAARTERRVWIIGAGAIGSRSTRRGHVMGLKVIGSGLGRTGTLSTKLALEQLGFAPCHHMVEVFMNPAS